jgi:hypothetical protein
MWPKGLALTPGTAFSARRVAKFDEGRDLIGRHRYIERAAWIDVSPADFVVSVSDPAHVTGLRGRLRNCRVNRYGMHDWTLSAELMAKVLAAKGYHYQFLFAHNAKHVDRPTIAQTLPAALEWLWKGYPIP